MTYMVNGRQYIAVATGYLREPQHIVVLATESLAASAERFGR